MYAVVRTGGRQYRVEQGRSLKVARIPADEGSTVELSDVLLIAAEGDVTVGTPAIDGARVIATVEEHGRDKKVIVFKYKAKVRTRKKTGHRQGYTTLSVVEILAPGQEPTGAAKKPRSQKAAETAAEAVGPAAPEPAEAEESTVEASEGTEGAVKPRQRSIRRSKGGNEERAPEATKPDEAEKPKRPRKKKAEE